MTKEIVIATKGGTVHPCSEESGYSLPLHPDRITTKLAEAGRIIGIDLLDHVIVGDGRHFSMKEAGHI